jgi:predicted GNAT superfamily acetyltransferase
VTLNRFLSSVSKPVVDHASPHPSPAPDSPIEVRTLRTHDEFVRCVDLQNEVWGPDFSERVPAAILKVAQRIGGIAGGAFVDDRLVGFVFGVTGVEHGRLVHWSDMLAVKGGMRDRGIGRRLKEYQRDTLRGLNVGRIYWTYDPLVSRNAHLNLTRLGARVTEYVPDMYGAETSSTLHRGLGTDRFIVAWDIDGTPAEGTTHVSAATTKDSPILNPVVDGRPTVPDLTKHRRDVVVRIAVPAAIEEIQADSLSAATRWRVSTRCAILWAMDAGYRVTGFVREDADINYYVCTPNSGPPSGPTDP